MEQIGLLAEVHDDLQVLSLHELLSVLYELIREEVSANLLHGLASYE